MSHPQRHLSLRAFFTGLLAATGTGVIDVLPTVALVIEVITASTVKKLASVNVTSPPAVGQ
jgi:hypothetical protein